MRAPTQKRRNVLKSGPKVGGGGAEGKCGRGSVVWLLGARIWGEGGGIPSHLAK